MFAQSCENYTVQYLQDKSHITSIDNFEKVGFEKKRKEAVESF